jgi:hypothetical protein
MGEKQDQIGDMSDFMSSLVVSGTNLTNNSSNVDKSFESIDETKADKHINNTNLCLLVLLTFNTKIT